jgi:hypothetical protein
MVIQQNSFMHRASWRMAEIEFAEWTPEERQTEPHRPFPKPPDSDHLSIK